MATVALTIVGTTLAGPIGGAVGALIGSQVDSAIFSAINKPKQREGPRLKELNIQTSSYGSAIPQIFGTMRIAGTVIWATDLIERRSKTGGGKNKAATVNYSYSVNMAVALSSRPIGRIGRIWADGKLLRGAAGDFKVATEFRYFSGYHDQSLDPLLAADHAAGTCPAYRGLAYAVFEDFQLADFGNRIPSLTFEVFEREVPVPITDIFRDASSGVITGTSAETVTGYALDGDNVRSALAPLLATMPVILRTQSDRLQIVDWAALQPEHIVTPLAGAGNDQFAGPEIIINPISYIPQSVTLRHYEPTRDFQTGSQRSIRSGAGRKSVTIDLPAAIDAQGARRLADIQILQAQYGRKSWSGQILYGDAPLSVGDWIRVGNDQMRFRILELEHGLGHARVQANRSLAHIPAPPLSADAGSGVVAADALAGQTKVIALELPSFGGLDAGIPRVVIAAAGTQSGWRRAALSVEQNGGLLDIGSTQGSAVIGKLTSALPKHTPYLIDYANSVTVKLLHDTMQIPAGSGNPFANDAGIIWINGEFLRYARAVYSGAGQYTLTGLVRGAYGTDRKIAAHSANADIVLVETDSLKLIDEIPLITGQTIAVEAQGLGDNIPATSQIVVEGLALTPLPPVHARMEKLANGDARLSWVRRSRIDGGWIDGVDQPLVEEIESYAVNILIGNEIVLNQVTALPQFIVPQSTLSGQVTIEITQIGRFARSGPLTVSVQL